MGMILVGRRLDQDELGRLLADPSLTHELLDEEHSALELDLDKAWHGLHFLLADSPWETVDGAGEAVLGGDPIGDDVGYGPARLMTPAKVRVVAAGLRDVGVDALRGRYDAATLSAAQIYPDIWAEPDVFDSYLAPNFTRLRDLFLRASDAGQAVLLAIT
jgi:hypothetical protein